MPDRQFPASYGGYGSILGRTVQLAVDVNGLVIPGQSIESALARHAVLLVAYNDDPTYPVTLIGSAAAVRFRGRELLLVTQHQLKNVDESRVAMLASSGGQLVTSEGYRAYRPDPDTDAFDIAAFDFTEPSSETAGGHRRHRPLTCP